MATKRTRTFKMNGDGTGEQPDEIEMAPPEPVEPETEVELTEEPAGEPEGIAASDDLAEQLAAARRQAEEANRRAEEAEAERNRLRDERGRDQTALQDSRMLVLDTSIRSMTAEKDQVKRDLVAAKEAGDYAAEAEAIDKLTALNNKLRNSELAKGQLEQQIEDAKTRTGDPVEAYISTLQNPAAQQWLRNHRDLVDPQTGLKPELLRAHYHALAEGAAEGSPGYFQAIEARLGGSGGGTQPAAQPSALEPEPAPQRRSAQPPAAPVRGNGSPPEMVERVGVNRYRLSPEQAQTARDLGLTPKEYLAGLLELEKEGAFTRH